MCLHTMEPAYHKTQEMYMMVNVHLISEFHVSRAISYRNSLIRGILKEPFATEFHCTVCTSYSVLCVQAYRFSVLCVYAWTFYTMCVCMDSLYCVCMHGLSVCVYAWTLCTVCAYMDSVLCV